MKQRRQRKHWLIPLMLFLALGALLQGCTGAEPGSSGSSAAGDDADGPQVARETPEGGGNGASVPSGGGNGGQDSVAEPVDANQVLAAGLAEADRTKRLVFLHSGACW